MHAFYADTCTYMNKWLISVHSVSAVFKTFKCVIDVWW